MDEFLTVAVVMLAFYKIIELFVKRKERRAIIEKIDFAQETNVNIERIIGSSNFDIHKKSIVWGCLFVGMGLGVVVAYLLAQYFGLYVQVNAAITGSGARDLD